MTVGGGGIQDRVSGEGGRDVLVCGRDVLVCGRVVLVCGRVEGIISKGTKK